jgi:hypothetical protein
MKQEKRFYNNKYFKIMVGTIITAYVFFPISKNKTNLNMVNGIVLSLKNTILHYEGKDSSNYRFLEVTNYEKPFEIFLGKYSWDFKPDLQKVDQLKLGDSVKVWYDESFATNGSSFNNLTYIIERNGEDIYVRGKSSALKVYLLLILTIIVSSSIIYLCTRFIKKTPL